MRLKFFLDRIKYFWKEHIGLLILALKSDYFSIIDKFMISILTILLIIPWTFIDVFDKKLKHN